MQAGLLLHQLPLKQQQLSEHQMVSQAAAALLAALGVPPDAEPSLPLTPTLSGALPPMPRNLSERSS